MVACNSRRWDLLTQAGPSSPVMLGAWGYEKRSVSVCGHDVLQINSLTAANDYKSEGSWQNCARSLTVCVTTQKVQR